MTNPSPHRLTLKKNKLGNISGIAKMAAPKSAQFVYNALRVGPKLIMRSAYELLRANIITRVLSALVLLSIDTVSFIRKRISLKQYLIDITLAMMLVVGGTLGWAVGSHIGSVLLENAVLLMMAGIAGAGILGAGLGAIVSKIITRFVQDDNADMLVICNKVYDELTDEYKLDEQQQSDVCERVYICDKMLKDMFCRQDRAHFARAYIQPFCEEAAQREPHD